MLLVFVGQVTATTVIPCKMLSQKESADMEHSMDMNMVGMDHSMHQMGDDSKLSDSDSTDSSIPNCCKTGANCSMGSCLTMLSITTNTLNKPQITIQKVLQPTLALVSQIPSSLYRPPIFS